MEKAYKQTKNFDRLSFLYLVTGSTDKLSKMQKIADARGDPMSRFHNALYAGDVRGRITVLREVGMCEYAGVIKPCASHLSMMSCRSTGVFDGEDEWLR